MTRLSVFDLSRASVTNYHAAAMAAELSNDTSAAFENTVSLE
jgi:hypothetical protein